MMNIDNIYIWKLDAWKWNKGKNSRFQWTADLIEPLHKVKAAL